MSKLTISPIDELHNKAMALADEAYYARRKGTLEQLPTLYRQAFEYEKAAAMLLVNDYEAEPSRSVLFRSAASLLLNLPEISEADYRDAEQMIAFGLSGQPPAEIADELREVWGQIQQKYNIASKQAFRQKASNVLETVKSLLNTVKPSEEDKAWLASELESIEEGLRVSI